MNAPAESCDVRAFLQLCLIAHRSEPAQEAVRRAATSSTLPWDDICALAESERVGPLIYRALREVAVPAAAMRRLQDSYRRTSLRNMLLLSEVGVAVQAMAHAGI